MSFSVPPRYQRTADIKRPKLDGFTGFIDQWLQDDLSRNRKQRHTPKRIFERLWDEHGFKGGYRAVYFGRAATNPLIQRYDLTQSRPRYGAKSPLTRRVQG